MKLIFAQMDLKNEFKDVTQMTFDIVQRELGLNDNPTNVLLTIGPMNTRVSEGGFITDDGVSEGKIDEDGFIRVFLGAQEPRRMMKTLCHELTHICQTVSGSLTGIDGPKPYLKWRGADVTEMALAAKHSFKIYEGLPWEAQAREMADKIMPKVDAEFHKRWPDGLGFLRSGI